MSLRERTQRRAFDRQLKRLGRDGDEEARNLVAAMTAEMKDDVYQLSIDKFLEGKNKDTEVIAYDESQTPVLDKLLEFFKWLWESGALLEIIKLFLGGVLEADSEVSLYYAQFEG